MKKDEAPKLKYEYMLGKKRRLINHGLGVEEGEEEEDIGKIS